MTTNEYSPRALADREFAQIRQLLGKGTAELEHSNLNDAHEALLAARRIFVQLSEQIARWSREQQVFTLQLAQIEQAIARSERRLAAHRTNALKAQEHAVRSKTAPPPEIA